MSGSVPMFTAFGIRVRAHASLIIAMVLVLVFGVGGFGNTFVGRLEALCALFLIVLLHEFGHCMTARWVGGSAEDILMTPLGGLAFAHPPHRPLPTFLTVAGGPAVNVLICLVTGAYLVALGYWLPINIFRWTTYVGGVHPLVRVPYDAANFFILLVFSTSWILLVFNVLPIYPLDGGQMLQAILWPHIGNYKSLKFAAITGMVGAGLMALYGIFVSLMLILVALSCFIYCWNLHQQLKYAEPDEFDNADGVDYSASIYAKDPKPRRPRKNWFARRAASLEEERAEQNKIDSILAKVSAKGMNSLTWSEKRALRQATERQRRRDLERNRRMKM